MSQILKNLEDQDLIIRTPSDTDKRKTAISLSEHGHDLVDKSRHIRDEWLAAAIESTLTAGEREIIGQAISIIDRLADTK